MMEADRYQQSRTLLRAILRYPMRRPMYYRSNVALHEERVLALAKTATPFLREQFPKLNLGLLEALALIHDDTEIIDSIERRDLPLTDPRERRTQDMRAIGKLNGRYLFKVGSFEARSLLTIYLSRKDYVESQIVDYLDIFDGLGESIHEIAAGNDRFLDLPEVHRERLLLEKKLYPALEQLSGKGHPLFDVAPFNLPLRSPRTAHKVDSLAQESGYPSYDFWKRAIVMNGGLEAFDSLYMQKEGIAKIERKLLTVSL